MKKVIIFVLLVLLLAPITSKGQEIDLAFTGESVHYVEGNYNNHNVGVVLTLWKDNYWGIGIQQGIYYNSFGRPSVLLGVGKEWGIHKDRLIFSLSLGIATGYEEVSKGNIIPFPVQSVKVKIRDPVYLNISHFIGGVNIGIEIK